MCPTGFARLPQCAVCEDGYSLNHGACEPCSSAWWEEFLLRPLAFCTLELMFVCYMYKRFNRPNPSGLVMLGFGVAFYQYLLTVASLPLKWPRPFEAIFSHISVVITTVAVPIVRPACITGNAYTWRVIRSTASPLLLFVYMAILCAGARICGRRCKRDFMCNIIGLVFNGLFIVITRIALMLFLVDPMPNGKNMVKQIPELEFGGNNWLAVWPIGVGAFCMYNLTFLALVTRAVVMAPKLVASDAGFLQRYRFAFGSTRPDRWWWTLANLVFGVSLNLVQVLSRNIQLQLYLTILMFIIFAAFEFQMQPYKFRNNNFVDLFLKYALIIFLVFATAFVDTASISVQDVERNEHFYAIIMVGVLVIPMLLVVAEVGRWAVFSAIETEGKFFGRAARVVFGFRDAMTEQLLLSDREVLARLAGMGEADLHKFTTARNTVLTTLLGEQPGHALRDQRLLPGTPFKVWEQSAMAQRVLRAVRSGQLHASVERNAAHRILLLKLAREMEPKGMPPFDNCAKRGVNSSTFVESLKGKTSLTDDETQAIFDILDIDGDGYVSAGEFSVTMQGLIEASTSTSMRQTPLRRLELNEARQNVCENAGENSCDGSLVLSLGVSSTSNDKHVGMGFCDVDLEAACGQSNPLPEEGPCPHRCVDSL